MFQQKPSVTALETTMKSNNPEVVKSERSRQPLNDKN